MKYLLTVIALSLSVTSVSIFAGQTEYDDCILKHLKNAKLDAAVHLIKQACDENYNRPNFTSKKKQAYNNCLLEHLVGVESRQAVLDINAACGRKHR